MAAAHLQQIIKGQQTVVCMTAHRHGAMTAFVSFKQCIDLLA